MDRLCIEQAHILGNSMGGMIAQEMAICQPERVRTLTLQCTWPACDAVGAEVVDVWKIARRKLTFVEFNRLLGPWAYTHRYFADPAYLEWSGMRRDEFATHRENVEAGVDEGLVPVYALASSEDDFDRYEALQWRAAERYARAHPDDVDVPALLERVTRARHEYLAWGRETLGWSLYLFRKP